VPVSAVEEVDRAFSNAIAVARSSDETGPVRIRIVHSNRHVVPVSERHDFELATPGASPFDLKTKQKQKHTHTQLKDRLNKYKGTESRCVGDNRDVTDPSAVRRDTFLKARESLVLVHLGKNLFFQRQPGDRIPHARSSVVAYPLGELLSTHESNNQSTFKEQSERFDAYLILTCRDGDWSPFMFLNHHARQWKRQLPSVGWE
jgi:hypothetical protein